VDATGGACASGCGCVCAGEGGDAGGIGGGGGGDVMDSLAGVVDASVMEGDLGMEIEPPCEVLEGLPGFAGGVSSFFFLPLNKKDISNP